MTNEIPKQEWKNFFNDIGNKFKKGTASIEIFNDALGTQILAKRLPVIGFVVEDGNSNAIEIILGEGSGVYFSHAVVNADRVYFHSVDGLEGTAEIVDKSGGKTLVSLTKQISSLAPWEPASIVALGV